MRRAPRVKLGPIRSTPLASFPLLFSPIHSSHAVRLLSHPFPSHPFLAAPVHSSRAVPYHASISLATHHAPSRFGARPPLSDTRARTAKLPATGSLPKYPLSRVHYAALRAPQCKRWPQRAARINGAATPAARITIDAVRVLWAASRVLLDQPAPRAKVASRLLFREALTRRHFSSTAPRRCRAPVGRTGARPVPPASPRSPRASRRA